MSRTAVQLVRELASRASSLLLTGTALSGTTTTLVDPFLEQHFPGDVAKLNAWVYCPLASADVANRGLERRAKSWTLSGTVLTLYPGAGFAVAPASGPYELHLRWQRARILEAINDGVGQLACYWSRQFTDNSITTAAETRRYTLPATQDWIGVSDVQIQLNPDDADAPYASAGYLNWRVEHTLDAGVEAWALQFESQPPPDRILRIFGYGGYDELVTDASVLALTDVKYERAAINWLYDWGLFKLNQWSHQGVITLDDTRAMQRELTALEQAKRGVLELAPGRPGGRINVPGRGTGAQEGSRVPDMGSFHIYGVP